MSNTKYIESERMFALTIHSYSPRAYQYIRELFDNHLPDVSTLRKWYAHSSGNVEPGFCQQSLEVLAKKVKELKAGGSEPVCSLIFDEMAIKKHLQWSQQQKKFIGQINYGFRPDRSEVPLANNALVFMLNGINFDLTVAIATYFITTLDSEEKVTLLKKVMTLISGCGVRILSISFDGLATNFSMCELLGVSFRMDNFEPFFFLPGDERFM